MVWLLWNKNEVNWLVSRPLAVSQGLEGQLTWIKWDVSQLDAGLCDLDFSTHLCPWLWIFKVKISNSCIVVYQEWVVWLMWNKKVVKQKGSKLIRYRSNYLISTFDHTHDLDCGFSMPIFEFTIYQEWEVWDWHGMNGMWVNRMLNPLCDIKFFFLTSAISLTLDFRILYLCMKTTSDTVLVHGEKFFIDCYMKRWLAFPGWS